jgi:ABC-2 type transport system ATP-binding protein
MDQNSRLVGKNVTVKKGKQTILAGLDFVIEPGKITGLIGPSGSGKTTLMRAIVGVQKISDGNLTLFSLPAGNKKLRPRIGYVTQSPAVYSDLTVGQNMRYFATLASASKKQIEDALSAVRLDTKKQQLVESLSGGERARVSLAIALLGNPDVLIMDEPTVGLDPILRQELWQLFAELAEQGKILLVSSHVMDEAEHCEQLLLMRNGHLLWSDSKDKLLKVTGTTTVEAAFIKTITEGKDQ